jgi:DNA adenine methylase
MKSIAGTLAAPFPWFGGKSNACEQVWQAFGLVDNYVEPFAGSAAMLLGAPPGKRVETINDFDGMVANFWRAIAADPEAVAHHADWPVNEADMHARHRWLVGQREPLTASLIENPEWFDSKVAGWWVWGVCCWIGRGWCGEGVSWRQIPRLSCSGNGINRSGNGLDRRSFIFEWFGLLHDRLRDVRVTCGDWARVCKDSVTTRHGLTAVFLDPPYAKGTMDYSAGGMGLGIAEDVRAWCVANGDDPKLRIVLCGHAGEHDALLAHGWHLRTWTARKGYAMTDEAVENSGSETLWCSPHCVPVSPVLDLFSDAACHN